jgi:hypothetical protein
MRVRMKRGVWPDLPKMMETIERAGYTAMPDRVELVLKGKVVRDGDRLLLEVADVGEPVVLPLSAAGDDAATAALLERRVGQVTELEGLWRPAPPETPEGGDRAGSLAVTVVAGAAAKKGKQ